MKVTYQQHLDAVKAAENNPDIRLVSTNNDTKVWHVKLGERVFEVHTPIQCGPIYVLDVAQDMAKSPDPEKWVVGKRK